jgi:TolB protein
MDGKSFFTQDLDFLYQFNLDGKQVKNWKLASLFPGGGLNSGSRITSSPDGKTLLVEVDMDEEVKEMGDWEGPPPALWTFDLETGKTTRVTEPGTLAASGCWLNQSHILCNVFSPKEKQPAIYEMEIGKKEMKLVIRDGVNPSVSRAPKEG